MSRGSPGKKYPDSMWRDLVNVFITKPPGDRVMDDSVIERLREFATVDDPPHEEMKKLLDDCAYGALVSDQIMVVFDLMWKDMREEAGLPDISRPNPSNFLLQGDSQPPPAPPPRTTFSINVNESDHEATASTAGTPEPGRVQSGRVQSGWERMRALSERSTRRPPHH